MLFQTSRLEIPGRAAGGRGGPVDLLAAGAHPGRIVVDERDDLHAGQPAGLDTWRDGYRGAGSGYPGRSARIPPGRGQFPWPVRLAGAGGPLGVQDLERRSPLTPAFVTATRECGFPPADSTGRPRMAPASTGHPAGPAALVGGRHIPPPGTRAAQSHRPHRPRWPPGCWSRRAGRPGVRLPPPSRRGGGARQHRGHLVGRRDRQPAPVAAARHRPGEQLIEHGIGVVADRPGVGANLSDHPIVTAMWHTPKDTGLWSGGPVNLARWNYLQLRAAHVRHRQGRRVHPDDALAARARPAVACAARAVPAAGLATQPSTPSPC